MKTNLFKTASLVLTLTASSLAFAGNDKNDDRNNDYAYYIMSPKNHHSKSGEKSLRLTGKSGEIKSVSFQGTVQIPSFIKVNASLVRIGSSVAYLNFDNVQCRYETKVNRSFFNYNYPLIECTDGSRANEQVQVNSKITLFLKEAKLFPAAAYATIKVLDTYAKGISLPQLEADKGQILRFDGELWVPTDYIPDGQAAGDVLVWDGTGWTASRITGTAGPAGAAGAAGEKGEKGDKGDTGLQGLQGQTGLTGLTGAAGVAGAVGAKGDKGDTGATGAVGATGAQGLQGPQGLTGAAGVAGAKGDKGDTGAQGLQGPQGLTGATGAVGPQGLQGQQGPAGLNGVNGAAGVAGAKGDKGDKGDAGLVNLTAGNGIVGGTISGDGGVIAVNTGTAAGQIPVIGANGRLPASILPDSTASQKIVFIKDLKPSGTHGGTCDPAKGWEQVRDLNSITGDTSFAGIAANTITLAAGTYDIEVNAPAFLDGFHKAILVNAQTGAIVLIGSNARSHNVSGGMEPSRIMGVVTLTESASFVIKHRCAALSATGFGSATSFGVDEVYTQVKITKEK